MSAKYFDLHIRISPDGKLTQDEAVTTLKKYGFSGAAVVNHAGKEGEVNDEFLRSGIEVIVSPQDLKKHVSSLKQKYDVVAVHGGDENVNRMSSRYSKVDFIAHPGQIDYVTAKFASERGVAIEFNVDAIIHTRGPGRAKIIHMMRENLRLVRKYGTPFILTSSGGELHELKPPRELMAIGMMIGMMREEAKMALSDFPEWILEGKDPLTRPRRERI